LIALSTYTTYWHRANGAHVVVCGIELYSRWVVPYNPYLILRFQAHINVEICSSIQVVKYIYKYFFKGHDRAQVSIEEQGQPNVYDEIQSFVDTRYVAAPEAAWRL
jgi:hypothetical protein